MCRSEETDEYIRLIDRMISEVQEMELEIISLRYLLSEFMTQHYRECMRMDILNNTTPEFTDCGEYTDYVEQYCSGRDPFNTGKYNQRIQKQMNGYVCRKHPLIYLPAFSGRIMVVSNYIQDIPPYQKTTE